MNKVFRKGRAERTTYTVLKSAENQYMGANYRTTGGGGSGGGGVTSGAGAPSGAPSGGQGLYYNFSNGKFYAWDTNTSAWDLLIN